MALAKLFLQDLVPYFQQNKARLAQHEDDVDDGYPRGFTNKHVKHGDFPWQTVRVPEGNEKNTPT